jgi:hypothetical protein
VFRASKRWNTRLSALSVQTGRTWDVGSGGCESSMSVVWWLVEVKEGILYIGI